MKYLIATFGSHGDILPFALIAKELANSEHDVIFYANEHFEYLFLDSKIKFVSVGTKEEYFKLFKTNITNKPIKALDAVAKDIAKLNRQFYYEIKKDISSKKDTVISSTMLFAAHLLKETENINHILIHLSPSIFRSNTNPARLSENWITKDSPILVKNFVWWALDNFFYEPSFTKPLNKLRKELNLTSKKYIFRGWIHTADKLITLFPQWFANVQDGFNYNAIQVDFLIEPIQEELAQDIKDFTNTNKPIVVFTAGTANGAAYEFFKTSMQIAKHLDIKAIFVSHFVEHIPQNLPDNILHLTYVSYSALLPKVSLFVHHGGIGSTAVALYSGTPQIICPAAYDQYDNSLKTQNLGVAKEILPKNYTVQNATKIVNDMLNNKDIKKLCEFYAQKFINKNTLKDICNTITHSH